MYLIYFQIYKPSRVERWRRNPADEHRIRQGFLESDETKYFVTKLFSPKAYCAITSSKICYFIRQSDDELCS